MASAKKGTVNAGQTYVGNSAYATISNIFSSGNAALPDSLQDLDTLVIRGIVQRPSSVSAPLLLSRPLVVVGAASAASGIIALPASGYYRHLQVSSAGVQLRNLIFAGPNVQSVSADGSVTLAPNPRAEHGGGISFSANGELSIVGCKIVGCRTERVQPAGGAIYASGYYSRLNVQDCEISYNTNNTASLSPTATAHGGGINATNAQLALRGANKFLHNKTTGAGACVFSRGNVQVDDVGGLYEGNAAKALGGGAFYIYPSSSVSVPQNISFRRSIFLNDSAPSGGLAYIDLNNIDQRYTITFDSVEVDGTISASANGANTNGGGALYVSYYGAVSADNSLTLRHCTVSRCKALNGAGGVIATGGAISSSGYNIAIFVEECTFFGNSAKDKGGVISNTGVLSLIGSNSVVGNTSGGNGGAFCTQGKLAVSDAGGIYARNRAAGNGGVFHLSNVGSTLIADTLRFTNVQFARDSATSGGIAFFNVGAAGMSVAVLMDTCAADTCVAIGTNGDGGAFLFDYGSSANKVHTLALYRSRLRHCYAVRNGGAIYANAPDNIVANGSYLNLYFSDCDIRDNMAGNIGGAVYSVGSTTLSGTCQVLRNKAQADGGAFYCRGQMLADCTGGAFAGNRSLGDGGVFNIGVNPGWPSNAASLLRFANVRIACDSARFGGAIYVIQTLPPIEFEQCNIDSSQANGGGVLYYNNPDGISSLRIVGCNLRHNQALSASEGGGVLYVSSSNPAKGLALVAMQSVFEHNTSVGTGGAINCMQGWVQLSDVTMRSNSALGVSEHGGALAGGNILLLDNNTFADNSTNANGGAIYSADTLRIQGHGNSIERNRALNGGGIFIDASGVLQLQGSNNKISHNRIAEGCSGCGDGGGLYAIGAVEIGGSDNEFSSDTAVNGGAVFYANATLPLKISNATFSNNIASQNGGAVAIASRMASIAGSTFSSNKSKLGGAIFAQNSLLLDSISMFDNVAQTSGGAVMVGSASDESVTQSATFALHGASKFHRNKAMRFGGSILSRAGHNVIDGNVMFAGNRAGLGGGAISGGTHFTNKTGSNFGQIYGFDFFINGATFKNDTACGTSENYGGGGGAISLSAKLNMKNVWIDSCIDIGSDNSKPNAGKGGGAMVVLYNDSIKIVSSRFTNNSTQTSVGGGLHFPGHPFGFMPNSNPQVVIMDSCEVLGNTARYGGGGIAVSGAVTLDLQLHRSVISGNSTLRNEGGGLWINGNNERARLLISRSKIEGNKASVGGGLWCAIPSNVEVSRSLIAGNSAQRGNGGGIYFENTTSRYLLAKNTFAENRSFNNGGGFYAANGNPNGARIVQNTFVGNIAETSISTKSGGGLHLCGAAMLVLNTVAGNAPAGIYLEDASTKLRGNLIAANTLIGSSKDMQGITLTSPADDPNSYNLLGKYSASELFENIDAQALPMLSNNGGATPTLLLKRGSVAQNAITQSKIISAQSILAQWEAMLNLTLQADQRDSARLQGNNVDYGAAERDVYKNGFPHVHLLGDTTICENSKLDLRTLIKSAENVRDTLFCRDAAFGDTIREPWSYDVTSNRVYIRFTSFDKVSLDTFVVFTLQSGTQLSPANTYDITYCGVSLINLNEKFEGINATDTLEVFADKSLTMPLSKYDIEHFGQTGSYYVCMVAQNGCPSKSRMARFAHDSTPTVRIEKPSSIPELCHNDEYMLTADVQHSSSLHWGNSGSGNMYYTSGTISNIYYPSSADQNQMMYVWLKAYGEGSCAGWTASDTIAIRILPYATQPEIIIMSQPEGEQEICGLRDSYRLAIATSKPGAMHDLQLVAIQPPTHGFQVESITRRDSLEYPLGTVVGSTPSHTIDANGNFVWTLNTAPANAQYDLLQAGDSIGFSFATFNDQCTFVGGSYLTFQVVAKDACGVSVQSAQVQAAPIVIVGMPRIHYSFECKMDNSIISACSNTPTMLTFIAHRDSSDNAHLSATDDEEFFVQLPVGIHFSVGSYNASAYNAPVQSEEDIVVDTLANGITQLRVPMKFELTNGDSSVLEFAVTYSSNALNCGAASISGGVNYMRAAECGNITCSQIAGNLITQQLSFFIEKSQLHIGAAQVYSYHEGWSGVIPVSNAGYTIAAGNVIKMYIFIDDNNNDILDADEMTAIDSSQQTLTAPWLANDDEIKFSFANLPMPDAKQLIAVAIIGSECQCDIAMQSLGGITTLGDTVCQYDDAQYSTTANRNGYTWEVDGGTIVSSANTNVITVHWNQVGMGTVSVSYSNLPKEIIDTVWVKPLPTLHLMRDVVEVCADSFADIRLEYAGNDSIQFFATRQESPMLTGDLLHKAEREGYYYATVIGSNGCRSLLDSVSLVLNPLPTLQIVQPTHLSEPCYQDAQALQASVANVDSLRWSSNGRGTIVAENMPTTQYLPHSQDMNSWVQIGAQAYGSRQCAQRSVADSVQFFVRPRPTTLELNMLTQPIGEQNLCTDTIYELLLTAYGDSVGHISIEMGESGINNFAVNSASLEYPYLSGQWVPLSYIYEDKFRWLLPSNLWLRNGEQLRLRAQIGSSGCNFESGTTISFTAVGQNICGNTIAANPIQAAPFVIIGSRDSADVLLQVETSATPHTLYVCDGQRIIWQTIKIKNSGPEFTNDRLDYMKIYMPTEYEFLPDSMQRIYNADTLQIGSVIDLGSVSENERCYRIKLLRGEIHPSDSMEFRICIAVNFGPCDSIVLRVELQSRFAALCNGSECTAFRTLSTQPQSCSIKLSTYRLVVATIRNAENNSQYPLNTHKLWSGKVVLRNSGSTLYAGDSVRLLIVCDSNNNGRLDIPNEFNPLLSFGYATPPQMELRRCLNKTINRNDTLIFTPSDVPLSDNHQMLVMATTLPPCYCEIVAAPVIAVFGGESDSVCEHVTVRYNTTPGKSSYVWTCIGGTRIAGGNGYDYIDVEWQDAGVGTLTVSYRDMSVGQPLVLQARRRIYVLAMPDFALRHDTVGICTGEKFNLASLYDGDKKLQFFKDRNLAQPLLDNDFSVSEGGWYYAYTTNENGCRSLIDSVLIRQYDMLSRPILAGDSVKIVMVEQALSLEVVNVHSGAVYYWTYNGNPIGNNESNYVAIADRDASGSYAVRVTADGYCPSEQRVVRVKVIDFTALQGIVDEQSNGQNCRDGFARQGELLTYKLRITNTGLEKIDRLYAKANVPQGCVYVSGGTLTNDNQILFTLDDIQPEGLADMEYECSFVVRVNVPNDWPDGTPLSSMAYVFADSAVRIAASCIAIDDGKCIFDRRDGEPYPSCIGDSASIGLKLRKVICSNVITPNGDGENDCFFVRDIKQFFSAKLTVANRWGSVVFVSQDYINDCWDGSGLNDGVYFYTLVLRETADAKEEKFMGYVHLIK